MAQEFEDAWQNTQVTAMHATLQRQEEHIGELEQENARLQQFHEQNTSELAAVIQERDALKDVAQEANLALEEQAGHG